MVEFISKLIVENVFKDVAATVAVVDAAVEQVVPLVFILEQV